MAAILGLNFATVQSLASEAQAAGICQAANDNDPSQVVISGEKAAVELAIELAKNLGAKRAIMLPVSAPFHCELMAPAAEKMKTWPSRICPSILSYGCAGKNTWQ